MCYEAYTKLILVHMPEPKGGFQDCHMLVHAGGRDEKVRPAAENNLSMPADEAGCYRTVWVH